jgi:hypothetical protein
VWTSIHARLRADFNPRPAEDAALRARQLSALELARRRWDVKMSLSLSHFSGAGVPRNFERIGGAFAVRTIGPRARQLAVLVTMLRADFHRAIPARVLMSPRSSSKCSLEGIAEALSDVSADKSTPIVHGRSLAGSCKVDAIADGKIDAACDALHQLRFRNASVVNSVQP